MNQKNEPLARFFSSVLFKRYLYRHSTALSQNLSISYSSNVAAVLL